MVLITQERLKQLCSYDPVTGILRSMVDRGANGHGRVMVGGRLGTKDSDPKGNGRMIVQLDGKKYRVHRLAWLYVHGRWPKDEIDHINGDASDNRLCNLREAARWQNTANTRRPKTNKSGRKGVSWHRAGKKWQVHIKVQDQNMYLGLFENLDAAHTAYAEAAYKYRGEFARIE